MDDPTVICTVCGHTNLAGNISCAGCWSPLDRVAAAPGQEVTSSAERESRKKRSSRIRLRILSSTAAAIGVVLAVQFLNITIPILNPPSQSTRAPELQEISGWINTEPLTLEGLQGKVVLLDFWTYTCVNCIRTLPVLKRWYDRYAEYGLVIVGVHSPEFEFEKVRENLEAATAQYGVNWPIAQDNAFATWDAYNNSAYPSKYLLDKEGAIRYSHFGEGDYQATEQMIRELLAETGVLIQQVPRTIIPRFDRDLRATIGVFTGETRELYLGYLRNTNPRAHYIKNAEYFTTADDAAALFQDPGDYANHSLYLQGLWQKGPESLTHARVTENLEDYIGLKFYGTTVNLVVNYEGDTPFKVVATLEGQPIAEESRGADIQYDEDGKSFFWVDSPRMYQVVELPEYDGLELRLSSNSDQFSVFAYCKKDPSITGYSLVLEETLRKAKMLLGMPWWKLAWYRFRAKPLSSIPWKLEDVS